MDDTQVNNSSTMGDASKLMSGEQVPPKLKHEMDSYVAALMHIVHNSKTADNVVNMLKAAPPEESIPTVALQVNAEVEKAFAAKKQEKVSDSVKIAGAIYLASDLTELGNVSKAWDTPISEQDVPKMFQSIVSKYIHNGLKDGSIDPIQLQKDTEPILNEQQKQVGQTIQQKLGLPEQPTASMGVDTYVQKKTAPLEKENTQLKSLLQKQQMAQAAQQQQQQGGQV